MAKISGKVNINGLKKFQQNLNKLNTVQRQEFSVSAVKELAARLLSNVKHRTPVGVYPAGSGKTGGTLRRGWTIGAVVKAGNEYTIEVINPTEYAPYVEFGHRTPDHTGYVDGKFMLTISEQELQADAPKHLMSKLNKFVNEIFKA